MGLFEHFPYTNFHDLNLDKVLERTAEAEQAVADSAADAQQAASDAAAANSKATLALNTANSASSAASNAVNTANTASNTATNAKNTADAAASAAGTAVSDAAAALSAATTANNKAVTIYDLSITGSSLTIPAQTSEERAKFLTDLRDGKAIIRIQDNNEAAIPFLRTAEYGVVVSGNLLTVRLNVSYINSNDLTKLHITKCGFIAYFDTGVISKDPCKFFTADITDVS